jgi:Tol biopolymer transport system component
LIGQTLSHYRITAAIGTGGMGEVYRATDTTLGRDVAIKVLPPDFAQDPERLARFEREARLLASLNHPNIAHVYGFESATLPGGSTAHFLAMEFVEGEDLADRLNRGPIPLEDALPIARQIAEALEEAHEGGIVHRDLKPANIKVTPDGKVKVLDFGLAKAYAGDTPMGASAELSQSPTLARTGTQAGIILGTAAYMSPEQARGRPVDRRADIWSFGVVLYEMLTGTHLFSGETVSDVIAAVLKSDPDWSRLPEDTPPWMLRLLRRCLERDPRHRLRDIGDARPALQGADLEADPNLTARPGRRRLPVLWLVASGLGGVALAVAGLVAIGRASLIPQGAHDAAIGGEPVRAELPFSENRFVEGRPREGTTFALSPDGRLLAYVGPDRSAILLRTLATGATRVLAEGEQYGEVFFAPDSRQVGFVGSSGYAGGAAAPGDLKRLAIGGGAPVTMARGILAPKGASWGDDGWIYYSPAPASGLWRVRAEGGAPEELTRPDVSTGEKTHRRPSVLPGGRGVLFVVGTSRIRSFDDARIEALSLSDRVRHRLIEGGTHPRYVAALGDLVYEREGKLIAVPFDPERLAIRGAPTTVAEGIADMPVAGLSYHSISAGGTLAWLARAAEAPSASIVAMGLGGRATKLADAPFTAYAGSLSPDGSRLAVDPDGACQQIAIIDLAHNRTQQVTFEWDNSNPLWTPEGSRLIFRSNRGGGARQLHWQAADGSGGPERLASGDRDRTPDSVSGRVLAFEEVDPKTSADLFTLSLDDRTIHVLVKTPFDESGARFSPDGRFVAYQSNQSGRWEVYVQAYPTDGRRTQVSFDGGIRPLWLPSGHELVYMQGPDLMTASLTTAGALRAGPARRVASVGPLDTLLDVAPDGRLLLLRRESLPPATRIGLFVNWFEEVRRLEVRSAE